MTIWNNYPAIWKDLKKKRKKIMMMMILLNCNKRLLFGFICTYICIDVIVGEYFQVIQLLDNIKHKKRYMIQLWKWGGWLNV